MFLTQLAGYHPPGLPNEGGVLQEVIGPHGFWLIPLATTLGDAFSPRTAEAVESAPVQLRAPLILGSPEFMLR